MSLDGATWGDWIVGFGDVSSYVELRDLLIGGSWDTGVRTIWVQARDGAGNESNVVTGQVTLPEWPIDSANYNPMPVKMSIPTPPVTGKTFTLRPIYPAGFKMPADAFCWWYLTWGSETSLRGTPDKYMGNIEFERPASQGACTEWTFTLPYSAPLLYSFQFEISHHPYPAPDYGGIGIGGIGFTPFHATLGTTDQHVLHSNIPVTYLLPTSTVTPDVGQATTYRLYATDASSPPHSGEFWAYPTDCYLNPQFSQQGGDSFTFRPICSGPWVAGWTGTYHGWYMRNMYDPIADGHAPSVHVPSVTLVRGTPISASPASACHGSPTTMDRACISTRRSSAGMVGPTSRSPSPAGSPDPPISRSPRAAGITCGSGPVIESGTGAHGATRRVHRAHTPGFECGDPLVGGLVRRLG